MTLGSILNNRGILSIIGNVMEFLASTKKDEYIKKMQKFGGCVPQYKYVKCNVVLSLVRYLNAFPPASAVGAGVWPGMCFCCWAAACDLGVHFEQQGSALCYG